MNPITYLECGLPRRPHHTRPSVLYQQWLGGCSRPAERRSCPHPPSEQSTGSTHTLCSFARNARRGSHGKAAGRDAQRAKPALPPADAFVRSLALPAATAVEMPRSCCARASGNKAWREAGRGGGEWLKPNAPARRHALPPPTTSFATAYVAPHSKVSARHNDGKARPTALTEA